MDFEVTNLNGHYFQCGRGGLSNTERLRIKAPGRKATELSAKSCEEASKLNAKGKSFQSIAGDTWQSVDGSLRTYHWSQIERSVIAWRLSVGEFDV